MIPAAAKPLVLGARTSPLARIQALAVGAALHAAEPRLALRYQFSRARGDLQPGDLRGARARQLPGIDALVSRGGFTSDLGDALDAGAIDIAVHSWKDLPLAPRATTRVVATLPRADCRDVVLLRRESIARAPLARLRVLSSSERRRANLLPFLRWALPIEVAELEFLPVRGDIGARLGQLLAGAGDALVIAKAALDRMLHAPGAQFAPERASVRAALDACRMMIVPLASSPAAPGQGALAIEVRRDRADLIERLAAINDVDSFETVERERSLLARHGDDECPIGVSILRLPYGDVCFIGGELGERRIDRVDFARRGPSLPRPDGAGRLWLGDQPGADPFRRVPVPRSAAIDASTGLLVARAEALPGSIDANAAGVVWTAGLDTWRKLAARGVWVNGSDESLGESAATSVRGLAPHCTRWLKLSHEQGFDAAGSERLATYRLERERAPLGIHDCSHFFWRSGSQFLEYLRTYPGLAGAWHGCGPGNSWRMISRCLGPQRVRPFLSAQQFRAELGA